MVKGGTYAYGSYPDIDALFPQQAVELDRDEARGDAGRRCSSCCDERTMYVPIWQLAFINGVGPRVAESGFGLINGHAYSAPYEDITLTEHIERQREGVMSAVTSLGGSATRCSRCCCCR